MKQIGNERLSPLVLEAFLRLLPIQIIEIIVFAINTLAMVIGVTGTVIFGSQLLCGRDIGSDNGDRVVSLFSTGVVFLSGVSAVISLTCMMFSRPLAVFLGAKGSLIVVSDYIIGQVLVGMLLIFLPYNNDIKRCHFGISVMVASCLSACGKSGYSAWGLLQRAATCSLAQ